MSSYLCLPHSKHYNSTILPTWLVIPVYFYTHRLKLQFLPFSTTFDMLKQPYIVGNNRQLPRLMSAQIQKYKIVLSTWLTECPLVRQLFNFNQHTSNLITPIRKTNFNTNWLNTSKGVFRNQLNIYDGAFLQNYLTAFSSIIDVQRDSKYAFDKNNKYAVEYLRSIT